MRKWRMGYEYSVNDTPAVMATGKRKCKTPTREDVIGRNSFPSVNENKYLTKLLKEMKK